MRVVRPCRLGPGVTLALAILAGAWPTSAQERPEIEIIPQLPHSSKVFSVAFSPDGKHVLSSGGGTLKLWETATGRLLRTFVGDADSTNSIVFSPDGRRVLSGSMGTLRLWDANTGRLVGAFEARSNKDSPYEAWKGGGADVPPDPRSTQSAFSLDGKHLLTGYGVTLKLWDATTGRLIRTFYDADVVRLVAFSPDGKRLLSASLNGTLKVWDTTSGNLIRTFRRRDWMELMTFSPDGTRLLSGGDIRKLWDTASGQLLRTFEADEASYSTAAFSPDGTRVLSGSSYGELKVWDATAGKLIRTSKGAGWVTSVAISRDGLLLSGGDVAPKLWDTTGQLLRTFTVGGAGRVTSVVFSPDGTRLFSASSSTTLNLWDANTGELLRTFEAADRECPWPSRCDVTSVAFSPDGTRLLSGSEDETIKLWDAATGQLLRSFDRAVFTRHPFSPDGALIATGWGDEIKFWDVSTGQLTRTVKIRIISKDDLIPSRPTFAVAFSPDGKHLLALSSLWDAATGQLLRTFEDARWGGGTVFSPDGKHVLSSAGGLWDAATGQLLRTFEGEGAQAAFSPNGRWVLSSGETLKIWDTATGQPLASWGHPGWVSSVAFSPDGRRLVTGSADTTMRIWDVATGSHIATLIGDRGGEWLAMTAMTPAGFETPAGFYAASDSGHKMLAVVRGLRAYSVTQFFDQLYRPDLVRELLTGDVMGRHADAAFKQNLKEILDSGPVPSIELLDRQIEAAGDTIQLKIKLFNNEGRGIGRRLIWRLNGNPYGETEPPELKGKGDTDEPVVVTSGIRIDPQRDNVVTVTAYNGAGKLATVPKEVLRLGPSGLQIPGSEPPARMFIVAIGVDTYQHPLKSLNFAVKDVRQLAASFKSVAERGGRYEKPVQIIELTEDKAVKSLIEAAFVDLAMRVKRQDTLIVLIAGHGESVAGRYFYYPSDTRLGGDRTYETDGIAVETWARWLASVKVDKKLVIVDTCKSWDAVAAVRSTELERIVQETLANRMQKELGHSIMTAARDVALEGHALGHGVLSYAVLEALGTPLPAGERIDVKGIDRHVEPAVKRLSKLLYREEQRVRNKIDDNFTIGLPDKAIAPPPFQPVAVRPGRFIICGRVDVRSQASAAEGVVTETLNQELSCTEVQVVEYHGSWTEIAREGVRRGYVPANVVNRFQ